MLIVVRFGFVLVFDFCVCSEIDQVFCLLALGAAKSCLFCYFPCQTAAWRSSCPHHELPAQILSPTDPRTRTISKNELRPSGFGPATQTQRVHTVRTAFSYAPITTTDELSPALATLWEGVHSAPSPKATPYSHDAFLWYERETNRSRVAARLCTFREAVVRLLFFFSFVWVFWCFSPFVDLLIFFFLLEALSLSTFLPSCSLFCFLFCFFFCLFLFFFFFFCFFCLFFFSFFFFFFFFFFFLLDVYLIFLLCCRSVAPPPSRRCRPSASWWFQFTAFWQCVFFWGDRSYHSTALQLCCECRWERHFILSRSGFSVSGILFFHHSLQRIFVAISVSYSVRHYIWVAGRRSSRCCLPADYRRM